MCDQFQRTLIASDLTKMDQQLLAFVKQISQLTEINRLYLLHIIPDFSDPQNKALAAHQSITSGYPIDEKARDILQERAIDFFTGGEPQLSIEIIEGNIYKKLLHWVEVKEVDLVVLGRKKERNGSGIVPRRVARKVNCQVLFVPEEGPQQISSILVPVDFSQNSAQALKAAMRLKQQSKQIDIEVKALHVVNLLPTDYYFGLEYNQTYREALREEKLADFQRFLKKQQLDHAELSIDLVFNNFQNAALQINDYLRQYPTDLVIMGAVGHTVFESLMYGSVTERFIEVCDDIPVLILR